MATTEIMEVMENSVANAPTGYKFTNKKLQQHTLAIEKLMIATKRNMFEIAARLLVIRNENLFTDDNFTDVFDYADKVLGYKKNMVYKMTTAAEKYIEKSVDNKKYLSIMAHEDKDYTVSQLIELNAIEAETAVKLDKQELIAPHMTTKEIREVVKSYKNGEIDEDGNFCETKETDGETDEEPKNAKIIEATIKQLEKLLDKVNVSAELEEQITALKNELITL